MTLPRVIVPPAPPQAEEPQPASERFRELAELEQEIRRRLRSNQRFLEKFLDEDFVDDEISGDDEEDPAGDEEL